MIIQVKRAQCQPVQIIHTIVEIENAQLANNFWDGELSIRTVRRVGGKWTVQSGKVDGPESGRSRGKVNGLSMKRGRSYDEKWTILW